MSLPIEFYSVIVPKKVLIRSYQGGIDQYKEDCPNYSYREDEHITRVGFMSDGELKEWIGVINRNGLNFDFVSYSSKDFVVITNLQGLAWNAPWCEFRDGYAVYVAD